VPLVSPDAKAKTAELTVWNEDDLNSIRAFSSDGDRVHVDTSWILSVDNFENHFCDSAHV